MRTAARMAKTTSSGDTGMLDLLISDDRGQMTDDRSLNTEDRERKILICRLSSVF
jgi:hypothetical protein